MTAARATRRTWRSAPSKASATGPAAASSRSSTTAKTSGGCCPQSRRARRSGRSSTGPARKRGGGRVLGESAFMGEGEIDEGMAQFLGREPTPEAAAQFAEDVERLLDDLGNATLKTIALRKLEGHSSAEIALELGISARSVDRKLEVIREIWGSRAGMSSVAGTGDKALPRADLMRIESVCDRVRGGLAGGDRPDLVSYLADGLPARHARGCFAACWPSSWNSVSAAASRRTRRPTSIGFPSLDGDLRRSSPASATARRRPPNSVTAVETRAPRGELRDRHSSSGRH